MKLTIMMLTVVFLNVHASGVSQSITLKGNDLPLKTIFSEIKKQTGYLVFFNREDLRHTVPVSLLVKDMPLRELLDLVLRHQPLRYRIADRTIMLAGKPVVITPETESPALWTIQPIRGRVLNAEGVALTGATVSLNGSGTKVLTDGEGRFVLNAGEGDYLLVSYVGYQPRRVTISAAHLRSAGASADYVLEIGLSLSDSPLDEMIVQAYGSTTKRLNTGNISKVSGEDISKQPISNPLSALAGRVPGMYVAQSSGVPGSSFQVQIRGQNSISSGNEPFYVIDGVPFSTAPELQNNNNLNPAGGSPLNFINPNDISSIEVLKDADATAIYGSRGANGVILITTKKGKAGRTRTDFNIYQGSGKITRKVEYLTTPQYLEMRREAFKNDGTDPDPAIDVDVLGGSTWDPDSYTDWQDQLIGGTAQYTDAQANVSGGSERIQYLVGAGYHRETTVFPGKGSDQKASMHFSINSTSRDSRFKMTFSGNYVGNFTTLPVTDPTSYLTFLPPNAPRAFNEDGTFNWAESTWRNGNPYATLAQPYKGRTTNLLANLILSYTLANGLDFRTSLGYTNLQTDQRSIVPLATIDPLNGETSGTTTFNQANTRSWIAEPQLDYKKNIGQGQFSALLGVSFQQNHNEGDKLQARGFSSDLLLNNIQAASTITALNVTDIFYKYNAVFGRLNYRYKDRYILNATARRDGSSRFGPGNQFANFAAGGAAWIFSKEKWITDHLRFLSFGKLRASYGTTGNDQVADYTYLDRYNSTTYSYGGTQGLYPVSFYNPLLGWEQNKKMEAGLELGFLNDRFSVSVSYYRNRSSNQLIDAPLSVVTGFASISRNLPATVQNTGLEFVLSASNLKAGAFHWSSSFNLTIPRNKLLAFPDLEASSFSEQLLIGEPLSIFRALQYAGVDPATGLYQFMGKDGKVTTQPIPGTDFISVVNVAPNYYGGWQNSFSYKGLSLDLLFQFVHQKGANFLYENVGGTPGTFSANQPAYVMQRWQQPGDKAPVQRFNQDYSIIESSNYAVQSDQQFIDASFIRLRNLSLSYALPAKWLDAAKLQQVRIYLQGQNLLTITDYIGYDPENKNYLTLPPLKVLTLGVQFTF